MLLVYTDGSSAVEEGVGRLAGYGIYCSETAFFLNDYRQTNNTAELLAFYSPLPSSFLETKQPHPRVRPKECMRSSPNDVCQ